MTFIKTFEIKDAIEFSNCGIDPDTGKIKCFDLELQGRHSISKIETLINTFVEDKNFSFPSFSIFISG